MRKTRLLLVSFCCAFILFQFDFAYAASQEVQDYFDKAIEYETLEHYDEAIEMYKKILSKDPEYIAPIFDLANLYIRIGKSDEAIQNFNKILKINPSHVQTLSRMGLIYIQKEDFSSAIKYLDQANALKPDLADIHINYSKFYYVQKIYDKAIVFGKKAILLDSNSSEAYLVTAMAYSKIKDYREAIRQYIHVVEIDHNSNSADIAMQEILQILLKLKDINIRVRDASELYNNKNIEEAKKIYNQVLEEDPNNPEVYYGLANIASFIDQNNEQAIQLFKKSINFNSNYIYGYSGLALVYLMKEDIENIRYVTNKIKVININQKMFIEESERMKSIVAKVYDKKEAFQSLIQGYDFVEYEEAYLSIKRFCDKLERQEQASKYYQEGNKFLENKEYKKALDEFKTALQLYPYSKMIKEKWVTALRELRISVSKNEKDPAGHYLLGNTLRAQEKYEEAEKEYVTALDLDLNFEDAPGAHYWLGVIYEKQGRFDLAEQKFELVVNKFPDYLKNNYLFLDATWKLGNIYNHIGKYDQSIQTLQNSIERDPRWYYMYIDLANALVNKKHYIPAIEQIKYVLKKSPGHELAESKLKEIYQKMNYDNFESKKQINILYEQIISELENEKRNNPYSRNFSLTLGKAYLVTNQYGKAINELNIYLDKFPGDKKVEEQLLTLYRQLNYTPSEIVNLELRLRKALLAEEYFNKGNELYNKSMYAEALALFNNAAKTKEKFIKAKMRIGDTYANLKKYNEAVNEYKSVLGIDPNLADVYSSLSYIFNIQGFYDRAIEESERAIKLNPYFPNSYNNLGYAYMKKDMYEQAIVQFEKAIELLPHYTAAMRNMEKAKSLLTKEKAKTKTNEK